MKNKHLFFLLALMGVVVLFLFFSKRTLLKQQITKAETPSAATPPTSLVAKPIAATNSPIAASSPKRITSASQEEKVKFIQAIFSAPIAFYGRVIDQNGNPVSGAQIKYSAIDKFWDNASKYDGESDADGYFSISDIKGAGLYVTVYKNGYDWINGKSNQGFGYGMRPDTTVNAPPTKDHPAIFVLRKKALGEPLYYTSERSILIPKDGTPVNISLKIGRALPTGQGDLTVECWTSDQAKDAQGHYDWHCRFSVPGGGLLERTEGLDYQAPKDGYQPTVEITTPHDAERWVSRSNGEYYLKLSNGTYARAKIEMIAGGDHFANISSCLNPQPGHTNLEFDPAKQIK